MVRVVLAGVVVLGLITFFLTGFVGAADTDPGACDLLRLAGLSVPQENIERIEALLDQGANVNGKCSGKTLLMAACGLMPSGGNENKIRLVQLLLEKGADPNIPDGLGNTALISVLKSHPQQEGVVDVAKLLLDAGADVNARDKQGNSALVLGLKHPNKDVFQLFRARSQKDRQSTPPPSPPEEESTK